MLSLLIRVFRCLFVFAGILLLSGAQAAPTVAARALPASSLAAYGLAEWVITLNQAYANPFDPDEIAVDAAFTGPQGQVLRLPGFWAQDFRRQANPDGSETLLAQGQPEWRVRFCPPTPGRWRMTVTARDSTGTGSSSPLSFTVQASKTPGFVRRAPGSARYFQYDNGASYFLIGENICWAGKAGLTDYESWFPKLSAAGGNYARLWMANRPLEHGKNNQGR